jgi:hypothetical protein
LLHLADHLSLLGSLRQCCSCRLSAQTCCCHGQFSALLRPAATLSPYLQEAYEIIIGKSRGKEIDQRPASQGGWDFHDWFWQFSMKRRRGQQAAAAGHAEPPPEVLRQQWQAQVAGLRAKAAAKSGQPGRWQQRQRSRGGAAGAAAAAAPAGAAAPAAGPSSSSAAREGVWRSMTKNARKADKAAAEQAQAAQKLGERSAPQQAVAAGAPQPPPPQQEAHTPSLQPAAATQQPLQHEQQSAASPAAEPSSSGSSSHSQRLQHLLEHAATVVHSAHAEAAGAAHAHAQRLGRHLRGRLTVQQLASLLDIGHSGRQAQPEEHIAGNAVAADEHLHQHFEATIRRRRQEEQAAEDPAAATAADGSSPAGTQQQHSQQQRGEGSHSRKFANRDEVEGRLSTQLAGLKRRAALKQEA